MTSAFCAMAGGAATVRASVPRASAARSDGVMFVFSRSLLSCRGDDGGEFLRGLGSGHLGIRPILTEQVNVLAVDVGGEHEKKIQQLMRWAPRHHTLALLRAAVERRNVGIEQGWKCSFLARELGVHDRIHDQRRELVLSFDLFGL